MVDKKIQGKKNRKSGSQFELRVRKDLEKNGWFVSKWMNNMENGELIPAKRKYNSFMKALSIGTGFPDFIAFRRAICSTCQSHGFDDCGYNVIGVEAKSNGYLTKEERQKCEWLKANKIFSQIVVATKGLKRGEIIYKTF